MCSIHGTLSIMWPRWLCQSCDIANHVPYVLLRLICSSHASKTSVWLFVLLKSPSRYAYMYMDQDLENGRNVIIRKYTVSPWTDSVIWHPERSVYIWLFLIYLTLIWLFLIYLTLMFIYTTRPLGFPYIEEIHVRFFGEMLYMYQSVHNTLLLHSV